MIDKVKKKWLKALRSGDYVQGMNALCSTRSRGGDRFCCLGVLANELAPGKWEDSGVVPDVLPRNSLSMYGSFIYLEPCLLDLAELPSSKMRLLSRMNDEGKSFEWIADFIEKSL